MAKLVRDDHLKLVGRERAHKGVEQDNAPPAAQALDTGVTLGGPARGVDHCDIADWKSAAGVEPRQPQAQRRGLEPHEPVEQGLDQPRRRLQSQPTT